MPVSDTGSAGCVDLELVQRVCMAHLDAQHAEREGIVVKLINGGSYSLPTKLMLHSQHVVCLYARRCG